MATDISFVEHVAEQARLGERLTWKKMFGEYALYIDGKVVGFACDDSLFVKPADATKELVADLPERPPYPGAKSYPVADELLDDSERLQELLLATWQAVPAAKTRAKKRREQPMHAEIAEYHKAQAKSDREICELLYAQIEKHLPGAESKVWHRHPVWFIDGNPIVGYSKLKSGVRLMFWSGASFDEPALVPGPKFKDASISYSKASEVKKGDLKRWLSLARTIQWDYKNLVKRKGKLERVG